MNTITCALLHWAAGVIFHTVQLYTVYTAQYSTVTSYSDPTHLSPLPSHVRPTWGGSSPSLPNMVFIVAPLVPDSRGHTMTMTSPLAEVAAGLHSNCSASGNSHDLCSTAALHTVSCTTSSKLPSSGWTQKYGIITILSYFVEWRVNIIIPLVYPKLP